MTVGVDAAVASDGGSPATGSKEPWLGANLSLCLPGLGQWYAGARAAGALELAAGVGLLVGGGVLTFAPGRNGAVGMILLLGLIPLWLFSAWTGHRACRARAGPGFDEARRSRRDAWKAVLLSRFVPGLGQLYDRRVGIGILFILATVLLAPIEGPLGSLGIGTLAAAACIEAWRGARGRREGPAHALWGISAVVWAFIVGAPLLATYLKTNVVRAFRIPSASMAPTLEPGDRVLADLRARGRARPGDIVLIPYPDRPGDLMFKTVLGGPGDLVEFRDDGAYRNGERVLGGRMPAAEQANIAYGRRGEPFRVPAGTVFVVGDNHANSYDSKYFGPIPIASLQGRAYKIYWPPARARAL